MAVCPVADSKENCQFMSMWNTGLKRFEGMTTMWSGHRGGTLSQETSAVEGEQDSLGLWEEKPQGPESNQAKPPSQESSSGYVEETVAGIAQLKLGTPPH